MKSLVDLMMDYERGELGEPEVTEFFQKLVDAGLAWNFSEAYGRTANDLIERGVIHGPKED